MPPTSGKKPMPVSGTARSNQQHALAQTSSTPSLKPAARPSSNHRAQGWVANAWGAGMQASGPPQGLSCSCALANMVDSVATRM